MTAGQQAETPRARAGGYFEDFAVGQRHTSAPRTVTSADLAEFTRLSGDDHPIHTDPDQPGGPVLQGPFGIAVALGLLQGLGLHGGDQQGAPERTVLGLLDTHWTYRRPIRVGDELRLELTIVRCRRTRDGDRGVVTRHMALVRPDGEVVQEGTTATLLVAREQTPGDAESQGRAFGTIGWGERLAARLAGEPAFAEMLRDWDGTVGLRAGEHEVHLRIYRGTVLEVSTRAVAGATFTVEASELTWTELITAPRNEFVRSSMSGQFSVRGNGYEYLRLTRPLSLVMDAARALAREGAA